MAPAPAQVSTVCFCVAPARLRPLLSAQGGRGDLPEHHRAQRHSPGSQGTQGVPEVPQAAAGGGAGDGNAWEHSSGPRNHRAGFRELGEGRGQIGRF